MISEFIKLSFNTLEKVPFKLQAYVHKMSFSKNKGKMVSILKKWKVGISP